MVKELVISEARQALLELFPGGFPEALLDYCIENQILDYNKMRIAVIKKHFKEMTVNDSVADSIRITADKYAVSEKTVEHVVYSKCYEGIRI